jgi:hypothetical protein
VTGKLFEEANAEDLADAQQRLAQLGIKPTLAAPKSCPARQRLPVSPHRVDIAHEPQDTICACRKPMKRISEDVSERLDYVPGVFRVERHVRGVRACNCCANLRPASNVGLVTWWSMIMAGTRRYLGQVRLWAMTPMPRSSRWVAGRMCGASSLSCMWQPRARWRKLHWRIMSLIQTAKMNGIEPLAYLTDVLTRLPMHPNSRIDELLLTRWQPPAKPTR